MRFCRAEVIGINFLATENRQSASKGIFKLLDFQFGVEAQQLPRVNYPRCPQVGVDDGDFCEEGIGFQTDQIHRIVGGCQQ